MVAIRTFGAPGLAALLFGTVLAGCIQAESADTTTVDGAASGAGPQVATGPAEFNETTGAVEGSVTDTELSPVAGAEVGLLPDETLPEALRVLTDEAGHFSLSRVPPGQHQLAANVLGYTSATKGVRVEVGQVAQTQLTVERLATKDPYAFTKIIKGSITAVMYRVTPQCMYFSSSVPDTVGPVNDQRTLMKSCGGARPGGSNGELHFVNEFQKNTSWRTLVAELSWQPQTATTGKGFKLDINAPNITRGTGGSIDQADPYTWVKDAGKSPIVIRIDLPDTLVARKIKEADWYSYPPNEAGTDSVGCAASDCEWFYRIFGAQCDVSANLGNCNITPVDFGLQSSSTFTLYFSYFYRDPAPGDFTGLPDA